MTARRALCRWRRPGPSRWLRPIRCTHQGRFGHQDRAAQRLLPATLRLLLQPLRRLNLWRHPWHCYSLDPDCTYPSLCRGELLRAAQSAAASASGWEQGRGAWIRGLKLTHRDGEGRWWNFRLFAFGPVT